MLNASSTRQKSAILRNDPVSGALESFDDNSIPSEVDVDAVESQQIPDIDANVFDALDNLGVDINALDGVDIGSETINGFESEENDAYNEAMGAIYL
jgi:hypothetical protein